MPERGFDGGSHQEKAGDRQVNLKRGEERSTVQIGGGRDRCEI